MGLYEKYLLPSLIDIACSSRPLMRQREKVIPLARGEVLEVGIGSGLNLAFYDSGRVSRVWGLDPAAEMTERAADAARKVDFPVDFIGLPGEEIPLEDDSVDTVVVTYTLCSIPEPDRALAQMARVLRADGRLVFCEHGAAPDAGVRRWQDRLTPIWKRLSGGCHLNREIPELLEHAGWSVDCLETMYVPGWRPGSFNYWGSAALGNGDPCKAVSG